MLSKMVVRVLVVVVVVLLFWGMGAVRAADVLQEQGFAMPPEQSKPWVYWYWLNGMISREGITADLEAMASVGIGEVLIGHVSAVKGEGEVKLLSEEWWQLVDHAVREGKRVGVNIGMFNGPGWSQSGGPWMSPEDTMRYVVSSECRVRGPIHFESKLTIPCEPFTDIAVIAFPVPVGDNDFVEDHCSAISVRTKSADIAKLIDGQKSVEIQPEQDADAATIDWTMDEPYIARSLTFELEAGSYAMAGVLQGAGDDGVFHGIKPFDINRDNGSRIEVGFLPRGPVALAFEGNAWRRYRLVLKQISGVDKIKLSAEAKVEDFVGKQLGRMFPSTLPNWDSYLWSKPEELDDAAAAVAPKSILNLSNRMGADGTLKWDVPEGQWIVKRFGMTPTGVVNKPTSIEATGPECDKMSKAAVRKHFAAMIGKIIGRLDSATLTALKHVVVDSYEVGAQNWTPGFEEVYKERLGYDPIPWLSVLDGRVVGSPEQSERFLWDLRRIVADLIAENYVGELRELSNEHGLKLWLENYGHWGYPAEFLQYGGQADHVSGEFWTHFAGGGIEIRDASSASHIYGKKIVSAEAFTSQLDLSSHPFSLKRLGDLVYCLGVNHFVLHVYSHQPESGKALNPWFGTAFHRNNPWFSAMGGWVDYLRRCHYMLQQGNHVADVAYFIGEDAPKMSGVQQLALPSGYNYDYINGEVIEKRMEVRDGRWFLPDGMNYGLIVLPELETMRPELLLSIRDCVVNGAAVLGTPPGRSPSMQGYPRCDERVKELAAELWGDCDGKKVKERSLGKGKVFDGVSVQSALDVLGVKPEIICADNNIRWTHRAYGDVDIYFLSNQNEKPVTTEVSFRVAEGLPELWDPVSGGIAGSAWFAQRNGRTEMPVSLEGFGSMFVVFRKSGREISVEAVLRDGAKLTPSDLIVLREGDGIKAWVSENGQYSLRFTDGSEKSFAVSDVPGPVVIEGGWAVTFPLVPSRVLQLESLCVWSDCADKQISEFVGTAVYRKSFSLSGEQCCQGRRLSLDLGRVGVIAEVVVNGKTMAAIWKMPFVVDITEAAKAGENSLEIKVTNTHKIDYSGMSGPVVVKSSIEKEISLR